jgi:glucosamine-6-phosphate deaminase
MTVDKEPTPAATPEKISKDLRINTDLKQSFEDDELTPDSMSSRMVDSAIGGLDSTLKGELLFDRMSARMDSH